uniref:NADH dehydrogenase subunit 6 n=1 Tax=Questa ersei TaxID=645998 RepID=C4NTU3_9ANNE|nr:NADH dehydrogenase subunit 6 [Questa ersei]
MLTLFIFTYIFATAMATILARSPVTLGIMIMVLAILGILLVTTLLSAWLAAFTFLIYVGGLLMMFAYFSATAPNQTHNIFHTLKFSQLTLVVLLTLLPLNPPLSEPFASPMTLIMNSHNSSLYILLILTLFLALIGSVKLTQLTKAPLRKFNV